MNKLPGHSANHDDSYIRKIEKGEIRLRRDVILLTAISIFKLDTPKAINVLLDLYRQCKLKRLEIDELRREGKFRSRSLKERSERQSKPAAVDLTSGLIAHYPLTKDAQDESGNGNHGKESVGVTYGMTGARFNGTSSFIRVPDSVSLPVARFTIAAWVRPKTISYRRRIVEKGSSDAYWLFLHHNRANVGFRCGDQWFDANATCALRPNALYFIAGTFDDRSLRLYVNAKCVEEKVVQERCYPENSRGPLVIGWKERGKVGDHFSGEIRDLRIYNRALSEEEIRALYIPAHLRERRRDNGGCAPNEGGGNSKAFHRTQHSH